MQRLDNTSDLTSFASLLGDSFASKINLLTQILQKAHFPSLGTYKENLLANVIKDYIPTNYQVGTGFVLFVRDATDEEASSPGFDHLNMGSHIVSKQCDILVYDSSQIPVIFKDNNFVVLRPESVKAVIEVKGGAKKKEIDKILNGFYDFGKKWQECQLFYSEHHQQLSKAPSLLAMCWDISKNVKGQPLTNGTRIREQIANFYRGKIGDSVDVDQLRGFPILESLYVYNECEIKNAVSIDDGTQQGWFTDSGQFVRYDDEGNPYRQGDSTISSLLRDLHSKVCEEYNRFYSNVGYTRSWLEVPYEHHGFSAWLSDSDHMRATNWGYVVDERDDSQ